MPWCLEDKIGYTRVFSRAARSCYGELNQRKKNFAPHRAYDPSDKVHLVCVCVCFLPIHSGHQVRWTYQPGSYRRKVTQDFSSTFFLRCMPSFFSREGFSHSFPSSTMKSNFVYLGFNRSPPVGHFYFVF